MPERHKPAHEATAAFKCLCIAEIASIIAFAMRSPQHGPVPRSDLLALALTCKMLYEPAMDALWYSVHDFNRLFASLPGHLWRRLVEPVPLIRLSREDYLSGIEKVDYKIELVSKPLKSEDWARFEHYARRVRELVLDKPHMITKSAFHEFCDRYNQQAGAPIPFTHLRIFTFSGHTKHMRACSFLLSPRLAECTLELQWTPNERDDAAWFKRLGHVRLLKFVEGDWYGTIPNFCLSLNNTNLETLDLSLAISARSLYEMRTLPRLHDLRFGNISSDGFTYPFTNPDSYGYRSLQRLTIHFSTLMERAHLGAFGNFLRIIKGRLQEVELGSDDSGFTKDAFQDVLNALQPQHEPKHLSLYGDHQFEIMGVPRIDAIALSLLCGFTKLTILCLYKVDLQVSREQIEKLGASWPKMEILKVTPAPVLELCQHPSLDVSDLREFAHFRHLRSLCIPFNAAEGLLIQDIQSPSQRSDTVTSLEIPFCPVKDTFAGFEQIAAFISEVFPSAIIDLSLMEQNVDYTWDTLDEDDDEDVEGELLKQWNKITGLLS